MCLGPGRGAFGATFLPRRQGMKEFLGVIFCGRQRADGERQVDGLEA